MYDGDRTRPEEATRRTTAGGAGTTVLLGVAAVAVLAVLAAAANLLDTGMYPRLGIPIAATGIQVLVAALRTVVTVASAVALGSLLYAAFLSPAHGSGDLAGTVSVDGYRAVRRAGWSAAVAGVGALLLAVANAADLSGAALTDVLTGPDLLGTFAALEEPMGWFLTGVGFCVVALGCLWTVSWRVAAVLAAVAAASLLPPPAVGQAAVGRGHDWATDTGALQAVGLAVWLGVLTALVLHHRHGARLDGVVWRRARLLLTCAGLAWLLSSVVLGLLLVIPGSLTGTAWGRWQLVQAGLVVFAAVGWVVLGRRRRGLVPLAALSGLAVVVAGAMAHSVPPRFLARIDTDGEVLVGYDLPAPFSALRALLDWRVNILFTLVAVAAVASYVHGVRVLRARGDTWARGRTAAWVCGWVVVELSTSSGIGRFSPGMFSVHMISHMSLNMLAPVLLALGGPVTLALRALRPAGRGRPPGPREWVVAAVESPVARVLTHPLITLTLFVGSFYVLYFTSLFEAALRFHWAHQLMNIHFLAVGYLFFWPLIGVDRAPVRLPHLGRLAVLLAAMPFHAFFGIALMSTDSLIGGNFYRSLALPWLPDLLADQKVGGGIAWATGEVPMLLVVIALLMQWSREDERVAARHDRREERDDDVELRAYNEMLARLAQGRR
ncbi:cytochrome c oxidase assembly protein [Pseudonocardia sp. RS11V-5]|uniref:cytochrome c oxidase assembly protein n=1 Tax=Pseudonocardia terrae TaxID=2905831 RepID=UPI001E4B8BA5|nr:cytochrome c oxidase assembly protein [Pseudonocardia terrae]MCE3551803.1 cytochrome c oxidase assembly protein [Pseudonocardia terrae]